MRSLDFLAVVSRPDFPSGARPTEVASSDDRFVIEEEGIERFDLAEVGVVLYLPICLEVEETLLCPVIADQPWPRFAEAQWRPVSAYFEDRLTRQRCLNRPDRVRVANNKLLQFDCCGRRGSRSPARPSARNGRWMCTASGWRRTCRKADGADRVSGGPRIRQPGGPFRPAVGQALHMRAEGSH